MNEFDVSSSKRFSSIEFSIIEFRQDFPWNILYNFLMNTNTIPSKTIDVIPAHFQQFV